MSEKSESEWKICKNPTFWQWLRESFNSEHRKEFKEELKDLISIPIWESILGLLCAVFGIILLIVAVWPPTNIVSALVMFVLFICGILIMLHGAYRGKYTWDC